MKSITLAVTTLLAALLARGAEPWADPALNSENRLPARTYLPPGDAFVHSLAGTWAFAWEGGANGSVASKPPAEIETPFSIDVPSCVETRGWGVPHYVNIKYPHGMTPPRIDPAYNPTMLYRRRFDVPAAWAGRRLVLRFEGVASWAEVWVNARRVGFFEDARLPSEFDVTSFCHAGANEVCVRVRKWCDGSYVEDQDMLRLSGIFRAVILYAEPQKGAIRDFAFTTEFSPDYTRVTARAKVEADGKVEAFLLDAEGRRVELGEIASPRLWSSEDPYLYTLVMKTATDERRAAVGLRKCEIRDGLVLFNGRPIKFKGVNRHEMNPDNGYTLSLEEMERDVVLMKRANFNMVRMSHYPNDPRMYALCDKYGLYVCAEANVESHGIGYGRDALPTRPEWTHTLVERNVRNVLTYRNHASVVMWSIGNESGWGEGLVRARDAVKKIDPVRPYHGLGFRNTPDFPYGPDDTASDVTGDMYPSLDRLLSYAKKAKPHYLCEYECAMGNGLGNMKEYWDAFYSSDKLCGGCVWDWIDQTLWKRTDRLDARGNAIRFFAYGGDWDEQPNDGPFCANGLLDALRRPSAKLNECKRVQQPVEVVSADFTAGRGTLWNRFEFTSPETLLEGRWELLADGVKVEGGAFPVPSLAPRAKGDFALPRPKAKVNPAAECFIRLSFVLKRDLPWAKRGYELAWNQLPFGEARALSRPWPATVALRPVEQGDAIRLAEKGTEAVFSRRTGTLSSLTMGGKTILRDAGGIVRGPRLQVGRAFTDADNWLRRNFVSAGLSQLSYHALPIRIETNRIVTTVRVTGAKTGGFVHETAWTLLSDGSLVADHVVTPFGSVPALPRIGTFQMLDGALENVTWYGRGPYENYIDRNTGCDIGLWRSTVTAQYVDYIRPQDCGGKSDVRWAAFTDPKDGRGVRVTCDKPFFLQALHFTADDLDQARHRPGEPRRFAPPVPRREVCLSVDCRQTGLGCNNCGPIPLPPYRFDVGKTSWRCRFSPAR